MFKFLFDIKNRQFMRLWWAQLISQFGDRINQMALIGFIAEREPGSTWGLAKLLSFTIIPVFVVGPLAGALVDRWDRRVTLFVCDLARGVLVLCIPLFFMDGKSSMLPIYFLVFLVFCFSRFYVPAKMSIIPNLVEKENLLMANSLMTTTGMIAFVLGCVLGGFLVDRTGAKGGFIWNAVTFFISGLLIISIPRQLSLSLNKTKLVQTGREIFKMEKSIMAEMKEGVRYLFQHKEIRFVINMLFILLAAAGAIYVVIIVFIQQSFNSVTKDLGILAVFLGTGLFLGALGYGRWGNKFAWYQTIFFCLIVGGIMMSLFALAVNHCPNLIMAAALSLGLGLVTGPIFIAANTIVQLVSDENMRGKVFSALEIVIHFAFLTAMLASSLLSEYVARVWILVGVGVLFCMVGLVGFLRYKNGHYVEFASQTQV
jgi:MFS transporter, DHA3 family, macrolide efflux protein